MFSEKIENLITAMDFNLSEAINKKQVEIQNEKDKLEKLYKQISQLTARKIGESIE
eukprot:Pgem_evm1s8558